MSLIQAQIARFVEANTRFDADCIQETQALEVHSTRVSATLIHQLSFNINPTQGAGHLPEGVQRFANSALALEVAQQQLQQAKEDAPEAMRQWIQAEGQTYQRYMPAHAGFLRDFEPAGASFHCESCRGHGRVTCSPCDGAGKVHCHTCHGTGARPCIYCHGSSRMTCSNCMGRGTMDGNTRQCGACYGSGQHNCYHCNYGKVGCSSCSSSGWLHCGSCSGSGQQHCGTCSATGILHLFFTLHCDAAHRSHLLFAEDLPAPLLLQLQQYITLDILPQLAQMQPPPHPSNQEDLQALVMFHFDLPWSRAHLQVHQQHYEVYGLGPEQHVFQYSSIVSDLLAPELTTLQQAAAQASYFKVGEQDLLQQLRSFTTSEINLKITDAATQGIVESNEDLEHHGLVSTDYVHTALATLQQGFSKLQAPQLLLSTACLALVMFAIGAVAVLYSVTQSSSRGSAMMVALIIGVGLWTLTETLIRYAISRQFPTEVRKRIHKFLGSKRQMLRWRIASMVVMFVAVCFAFYWTPQLSKVQQLQQEYAAHRM